MNASDQFPRLGLITPVYEPVLDELSLCISSVLAQTSADWTWIIVDDGSRTTNHNGLLQTVAEDPRVKVIYREANGGISQATNHGAATLETEFIGFLDQDDMLQVNAVEAVLHAAGQDPDIDIIYSDEDKINEFNEFGCPFRKPEWSPERFRHQNYLNHLTVLRRQLFEDVGGLRSDFDGSQDYDLLLRATEVARRIVHIPEVLYHWRAGDGSVASSPDAKPYAHLAAVRAVQEHLDRKGIQAKASLKDNFYIHVDRLSKFEPRVSVIIPTNGSARRLGGVQTCLIENCVESVLSATEYEEFEILVVADDDSSEYSLEYLDSCRDSRLRVLNFSGDFNFSRKINLGVLEATGDIVVPLNDDTQVIEDSWLRDMVVFLQEPDVGAVAPILLLEDERIQSAGHFFNGGVHHVAPGVLAREDGPFGVLSFPCERSGLTFAAIALRRSQFLEMGGLNEGFPRSFNDVDFCNRLVSSGNRLICNAQRSLYHFESLSRDPTVEQGEVESLYRLWGSILTSPDPYLPDFWRQFFGV